MLVRNGKTLDEVTTEDLMGYAASTRASGRITAGLYSAHELLRSLGVVDDSPFPRDSGRYVGRQTIEEMVSRRQVASAEMRALFIRYLREREPGLDYSTLMHLENHLVNLFWRDLERHHPGIDSLHLPTDVATEWKARMWVLPNGERRTNITSLFTTVRAFYLDIAQWAIEEPGPGAHTPARVRYRTQISRAPARRRIGGRLESTPARAR
ncbi:MAG: hypothetical protein GEU68_12190 [Actinobacteria bacterium]|nr:hypothetical protein [Actinomycetota bacterium]